MKKFKRIFVIVADSLGVGADEVAKKYGDQNTNTLKHLSYSKSDFSIPTLHSMGIGNITDVHNAPPIANPIASYGKMREKSVGKDTLTGHWELMGLELQVSFPAFTDTGFPDDLISLLEKETGHQFLGNIAASGTEIIQELGEEHIKTKKPILYTSADSVLQIAAHESVIPLVELYRICEIARKITLEHDEWMVGRIIARPFIGEDKNSFIRTSNRHDYSVKPFGKTVLDSLKENKYDVVAIGKINDIFDGEGITVSHKTKSNQHGMDETLRYMSIDFEGLCFVNLVDFDAIYGHRRDAVGYATAIEEFDRNLLHLLQKVQPEDLVIVCADHGNDPTHQGSDHTREFVPLLAYHRRLFSKNLGTRNSFADIAATIAENFNLEAPMIGESFLTDL